MNQPKPTAQPAGKQQVAVAKPALVEIFAERYHVDPKEIVSTLIGTAFKVKANEPPATREEILALLVVANEYHLNPFIREIYAFRGKGGGIVPIIGVDGWVRIVERQPTYQGEEMRCGFDETPGPDGTPLGFYYECFIHRSDRKFPISRRQYYRENFRDTDNWRGMPTRMLQHRAYIQSARAAFGLGGIFDEDEGEVIALGKGVDLLPRGTPPRTAPPEAKQAEGPPPRADENQLELIKEKLAKTGVPDILVLKKFDLLSLEEIPADKAADVLQFIQDNSP